VSIFRRKRKDEDVHVEKAVQKPDPVMELEVKDGEDLWKVLQWVYRRTPSYSGVGGYLSRRDVKVREVHYNPSDWGIGEGMKPSTTYYVVFPQKVWDEAMERIGKGHAERKLRKEIFG
jgi:hypothetical protein